MSLLALILILLLLAALPVYPYNRRWCGMPYGYYPSFGLGTILLIVLIVLLLGGCSLNVEREDRAPAYHSETVVHEHELHVEQPDVLIYP